MSKDSRNPPWGYTFNDDWRKNPEFIPVISVKLWKIRKKLGMTQQDFAKKIGWNINKYSLMGQGKIEKLGRKSLEEAYPIWFILALADKVGANPYWLTIDSEETIYEVDSDKTARDAREAGSHGWEDYAMFAEPLAVKEFKRYRFW